MIVSRCANMLLKTFDYTDSRSTLLVFTGVLLAVTLIQWLIKFIKQIRTLPPGPWGLPFLGYFAFIGHEKHTSFKKLADKYGSIFSARLGTQLTVVLSDYKMIRDAFRKDEFTGRPDTPLLQTLNGLGKNLFNNTSN